MRPFLVAVVCLAGGLAASACGGDGTIPTSPPPPPPPPPVVATVEVALASGSVAVGQTTTATATARSATGTVITGRAVTWSSNPEAVATVSAAGVLTAVGPGQAAVVATIDGQSGTTPVTVVPIEPARCRDCLEVVPATALVVPGASLAATADVGSQLTVYRVDAAGGRSLVPATFESTDPSVVVSATGKLTAAGLGSSQVVARAGGLTSDPVVVLAAQPAAGALLVPDERLVGAPVPVDSAAEYGIGYRYRARLRGPAPAVGQVVLGTGNAPLGGRAVSVVAAGPDLTDVVLEVLPLDGMFAGLSIDQRLPLDTAQTAASGTAARPGPAPQAVVGRRFGISNFRPAAAPNEFEFALGPFECKAAVQGALTFPASLDVTDFALEPQLSLDLRVVDGRLERLMITGGATSRFSSEFRFTGAVEGSLDCQWTVRTVILPIGGPVALIFGGQVPVGLGVVDYGKVELGGFGVDAFLQSDLALQLGVDCAGGCHAVADAEGSSDGFLKPRLPSSFDTLKVEAGASAYLFAKLQIGNPFVRSLHFETVTVKAGLDQKAELAAERTQVRDPAYASGLKLTLFSEFATGAKVAAAGGLLGVSLLSFKTRPELPLALSPRGTFAISPGSVTAGDASQLGETATFTVTLDPVTYLGSYAVDGVEIRRVRTDAQGEVTLEPGRPGCTFIPATPNQTSFSCQTDFAAADTGGHQFAAFVHARIFGVPVPLLFEVGANGTAQVNVQAPDEDAWPAPPLTCPGVGIEIFTPEDLAAAGSVPCAEFVWISPDEPMEVSLPGLRVVEDIWIQGTNLRSVSLGGLQYADYVQVWNTDLESFEVGTAVVKEIEAYSNQRLTRLAFPALKRAAFIEVYNNPVLETVGFSCATRMHVEAFVLFAANPHLSTGSLLGLVSCWGLRPEQYDITQNGAVRAGAVGPGAGTIKVSPRAGPRSGRAAPPARLEARRRARQSRASAPAPR